MNLTITPSRLSGAITPPPSKSQLHRLILAAALAQGESVIENITLSEDISATLRCAESLGAVWTLDGDTLHLTGMGGVFPAGEALPQFDCGESGSTLRFLIPIALAVAGGGVFIGRGRLMERPLAPYFDIFREKNISFEQNGSSLTIRGRLTPGEYRLNGAVSSQFFTGALFALPLLDGASTVIPTSRPESEGYIRMTLDTLQRFGVPVTTQDKPLSWQLPGRSVYLPQTVSAESDWSQAAYWYAAEEMGSSVTVDGMNRNSLQGDSIFPHWTSMLRQGGDLTLNAAQTPDLVPPLAARAAVMEGTLCIAGIGRLRIKESDRIRAIADTLTAIGADITEGTDSLTICGRNTLAGGATVDAYGDHRIAMMLAIVATRCETPIILTGAECVSKSYPGFWEDYQKLGGIVHEHSGK